MVITDASFVSTKILLVLFICSKLIRFQVSQDTTVLLEPLDCSTMASGVCEVVQIVHVAQRMFVNAEAAGPSPERFF